MGKTIFLEIGILPVLVFCVVKYVGTMYVWFFYHRCPLPFNSWLLKAGYAQTWKKTIILHVGNFIYLFFLIWDL